MTLIVARCALYDRFSVTKPFAASAAPLSLRVNSNVPATFMIHQCIFSNKMSQMYVRVCRIKIVNLNPNLLHRYVEDVHKLVANTRALIKVTLNFV